MTKEESQAAMSLDPTNEPAVRSSAPETTDRGILLFPMRFFQTYLTATVLCFAFGPWPWPVDNPVQLYLFLILNQVCLWAGYKLAMRHLPCEYRRWVSARRLVQISLFAWIILFAPIHAIRFGGGLSSLLDLPAAAIYGIQDPGSAYSDKLQVLTEQRPEATTWELLVLWVNYPILWLLVPLGTFYWKEISWMARLGVIAFGFLNMMSWVSIGTNKGLADLMFIVPWMAVARRPQWLHPKARIRMVVVTVVILIGLALLVSFFIRGQIGRRGGEIPTYDFSADIALNEKNWLVACASRESVGAIGAMTSYLTQGYYGLSLAMKEPFTWCYGFGNSYFLQGLSGPIFGHNVISDQTYSAKIDKDFGWGIYLRWSSLYAWLANDLSFLGVPAAMFAIGWLFGLLWLDVIRSANPFAVALFALLLILLFYIPANNQILHFSSTFWPFWSFLPLWWLSRRPIQAIRLYPSSPRHDVSTADRYGIAQR